MYCAFGGLAALIVSGWWITVSFGAIFAPVPLLLVAIWYNFIYMRPVPGDTAKYITFHDAALEKKYGKVRAARVPCALAHSVSPRCCRRRRTRSRSPYCTRLTLTATLSSRAMCWSAQNPRLRPVLHRQPMLVIPLTASTVAGDCAAQDTLMNHRDEFVTYIFTFDLLKFLVYQFLGPLSSRSASQASHPPLSNPQLHARKLMGRCRRRHPHDHSCYAQL